MSTSSFSLAQSSSKTCSSFSTVRTTFQNRRRHHRSGKGVSGKRSSASRGVARSDGTAVASSAASASATEKPEPELKSEMGVDYATFRDLLKAGEWEKADDEHRRLMCVLAGEDAEDRDWVYFTEVKNMPVTDLKTIDALWSHFSGGRYGFTIQRKLWVAQKRNWAKFFKKIDWTTGENGDYRKFPNEFLWQADAAPGHMPLTNALRGTQLFEALMEHPAFAPAKTAAEVQAELKGQGTGAGEDATSKGLKGLKKPDWMS